MPINPLPPTRTPGPPGSRPKAPAAPPALRGATRVPPIPTPLKPSHRLPPRDAEKKPHWFYVLCGWIVFAILIMFVGYAIHKGLDDAQVKVAQWQKETQYKKCTGEFNTLSCHQRLSKERELKYKEFTRGQ